MKKTTLSIIALLCIPSISNAYTISVDALPYTDAPFTPRIAAGVRVLTDLQAISGNPDGTFAPNRTLNRAEFTKIALLSGPVEDGDVFETKTCFPDVRESDWFSPYVCYAKERGILAGYPDGTFKPSQAVNYAEALKILGELYGNSVEQAAGQPWYAPYFSAAQQNDTTLDGNIAIDTKLTRGQMAELAAAYYMHSIGMQVEFNQLKAGIVASSASSSSVASTSSSSSSSPSSTESSVSSSSSSVASVYSLESQILLRDTTTPAVIGGIFTSTEDAYLRSVTVRFDRDIDSFNTLELRTPNGATVAVLNQRRSNDEQWEAELTGTEFMFTANTPTVLYVHAKVKSTTEGFYSGENVVPRSMRIIVQTVSKNESKELIGGEPPYPGHITAQNTINAIVGTDASESTVTVGKQRVLASFTLQKANELPLTVKEILFNLTQSANVTLSNVRISPTGAPALYDTCNIQTSKLRCILLKDELRTATAFTITADVAKPGKSTGTLQLSILQSGGSETLGDVYYNDGLIDFTWFRAVSPVWQGTAWVVQ
jgi:S-layer homology domain